MIAAYDGLMSALAMVQELRPQSFGSGSAHTVRDPIVEPLWLGVRVLAAVDRSAETSGSGETAGAMTILTDETGSTIEDQWEIQTALAASALADRFILDGYLTKQVAHDGSGVYTGVEARVSTGKLLAQGLLGDRMDRAAKQAEELEQRQAAANLAAADIVAFVAIDILWLDGESLFDVPLLERKRLLDSVIAETDLIRVGQYVRPPIDTWVGSWRALGFSGMTFKAANGRYRPGTAAKDWATATMPRR
jgi:ATP dependent DNA ligase domain